MHGGQGRGRRLDSKEQEQLHVGQARATWIAREQKADLTNKVSRRARGNREYAQQKRCRKRDEENKWDALCLTTCWCCPAGARKTDLTNKADSHDDTESKKDNSKSDEEKEMRKEMRWGEGTSRGSMWHCVAFHNLHAEFTAQLGGTISLKDDTVTYVYYNQ
jgi:hypothetical protein